MHLAFILSMCNSLVGYRKTTSARIWTLVNEGKANVDCYTGSGIRTGFLVHKIVSKRYRLPTKAWRQYRRWWSRRSTSRHPGTCEPGRICTDRFDTNSMFRTKSDTAVDNFCFGGSIHNWSPIAPHRHEERRISIATKGERDATYTIVTNSNWGSQSCCCRNACTCSVNARSTAH